MADSSENLYLFGDDLEAILAILEDDEALEDQFSNAASDAQSTSLVCGDCGKIYKTKGGYTRHRNAKHMGNQGNQPSSLTPSMLADIVNSTVQKVKEGKVFAASLRNEFELYEYEQPDENSEEFSVLQLLYDGFSKNKNTEKFYGSYYAQIPLKSTSFFKELSRNAATLLSIKVADNMVAHCKRVSNASTVSSSLPSKTVLCEKEKAGLQYLGGYVLHNLHKKCTRMDTTESQQAMAILKAGRLENNFESQKLVSSLSRGGLWAITENAQKVFTRTEHYFRLSAAADGAHKVDISGITNQASRDSEVISYYQNMVSDAETVPASHTSKDMV